MDQNNEESELLAEEIYKEKFMKMSDQERLSLFMKRLNSGEETPFDEYLKQWWIQRY